MKEENLKQIPSYPLCILPQAGYIKQIDGNVLCSKTNGLIIQRRCADHIKDNALQPEIFGNNLAEMSVNLLGGCFLPEHVKFTPKGVVDFIVKTDFDGIYEYCPDARGIYLSIPDIHNAEFPSRRKFPNQGESPFRTSDPRSPSQAPVCSGVQASGSAPFRIKHYALCIA